MTTPNTRHTPGLWKCVGKYPVSIVVETDETEICIAVIEQDGGYEASTECQQANAELIASAPETAAERDRLKLKVAELLEALKSSHPAKVWDLARQYYTNPNIDPDNRITEWHNSNCDKINALIASSK